MKIQKIIWALSLMIKKPLFHHVGSKSYLGKPISLIGTKNISIGNRVRIYPGCRMETHEGGHITINDDCSIGQNFHITSGNSNLSVGKNTTISGNVFITNIDHEYQNIDKHILEQPKIFKETVIGDNCFIGYGASIQAGTKLGKQCIVGTNAVVRGEFPDYCVIAGIPAKIIKEYDDNSCKWRRIYEVK